jgi:hypothetical protein
MDQPIANGGWSCSEDSFGLHNVAEGDGETKSVAQAEIDEVDVSTQLD